MLENLLTDMACIVVTGMPNSIQRNGKSRSRQNDIDSILTTEVPTGNSIGRLVGGSVGFKEDAHVVTPDSASFENH
ncbi:MAG: hypothetical protein LBT40_03655 [Deltaproteobacteria bacterium]|nr:hypothetical protein [Deltaproteobacteria bacterium]